MAELSAPQQNRLLGQLANMLRTTEGDIAAPEFLPRGLDVMGLVRQLMLPSAETVEKLSYGDPLFRMPMQSNIPITADREYLADIAGMIPFGAPAARPTARGIQDLVRQIQTEPPVGSIRPTASSAREKVASSELIGPFYHASPKSNIEEFRATTKQERKETGFGDPRGVFFTQDPNYASGYGRYLYETYIPRRAITWNTGGQKDILSPVFNQDLEAIVPQEFADMVKINRVIDLSKEDMPQRPDWWYESYKSGLLDEPAQSVAEAPTGAVTLGSKADELNALKVRLDELNNQFATDTAPPSAVREHGAVMKRYQELQDELFPRAQTTPAEVAEETTQGLLDTSYRGGHSAPNREFGAQLHQLDQIFPDDIYSPQAARNYGHYGGNDPMDRQTMRLAQSLRGKPDADVTIYRAVPKDEKIKGINQGDWVTINKQYAKEHGESVLLGDYKILEKKVKAKDIWTNADSIHEYGYDPD